MTVTSYFKGFYQCSRNIRIDALERLRDKIPTILCDLEKIYPPAFFDVMHIKKINVTALSAHFLILKARRNIP